MAPGVGLPWSVCWTVAPDCCLKLMVVSPLGGQATQVQSMSMAPGVGPPWSVCWTVAPDCRLKLMVVSLLGGRATLVQLFSSCQWHLVWVYPGVSAEQWLQTIDWQQGFYWVDRKHLFSCSVLVICTWRTSTLAAVITWRATSDWGLPLMMQHFSWAWRWCWISCLFLVCENTTFQYGFASVQVLATAALLSGVWQALVYPRYGKVWAVLGTLISQHCCRTTRFENDI